MRLLAAGICLLAAGAALAQTSAPGEGAPVRLDQVVVRGESAPGWLDLPPAQFEWQVPENLAASVDAVPGLALHHMGAAAAEPLLRGLGSDRVVIALDGLPLPNASPTRTASPLALITAGLPDTLAVGKSLPSVTLGPPANAGYIELSAPDHGPRPYGSNRTYVGTAWNLDRDGGAALATTTASRGAEHLRAALAAHDLGDYTAGDGTVVPATDRNAGAALDLAWQPDPRHQLRVSALFSRQLLAVNSALPLDTRDTDTFAVAGSGSWGVAENTSIDTRLGLGLTRPHLDNRGRPAPAPVSADGRTRSLAAGVAIRHRTDGGDEMAVGIDGTEEERDLHRQRPGAIDRLWPDLRQSDVGGFAELTHRLGADWKLRLGARLDAARSEARAANATAFNRVIRDLYAAYNGPGAAQTDRDDVAGAANALLTGQLAPALTTSVGVGFSRQPPGASERYRAFSDALGGGYEIGNPTARPEDKYEADWSLRWQQRTLTVNLDLFASQLPDYLHRVRVGTTTPPAPPAPGAIVYGYRATDAVFHGGELEILWQPATDAWCRLAAASVTGTDRDAHRALPELPPAALSLAVGRIWPGARGKPWIEVGARTVAAQRNPAPDEMPVFADTAAFTLASLRAGATWRGVRVSLAIENVFNRLYREYLSPPAAATPPSGTLRPGARIPGPGRTVTLTVSYGRP